MKIVSYNADEIVVVMRLEELRIVSQSLNEVSNALSQDEFATRMGAERKEVLDILKILITAYKQSKFVNDSAADS
jgi:hypothetical protein